MTIKTLALVFAAVSLIGFVAGCTRLIDPPVTESQKSIDDQALEDQIDLKHTMIIKGNVTFVRVTKNALDYVAQKSPEHYKMVNQYMKKIEQSEDESHMLVEENPPTFIVNDVDAYSPLVWYASDIVHDAYHSKLYHDYLATNSYVPDDIYSGYEAEMKCLEIQKEFLIVAGAEQRFLDWIEVVPETKWWED